MSLDAFPRVDQATLVRAMNVKSPCDFMWLLGAGTSITSGIKSATQCVWAWKRELFLTAHPSVPPSLFADTTDPAVQHRIQHWISSISDTPALGDLAEYPYFIERCYPRAEDRRRSLEGVVRAGRPGPGYRLLGRMIATGHFRWFWTTNFDDMLRRAIPSSCSRPIREYGMDTPSRLRSSAERDEYVNVVYLHGDYRYDTLRNTSDELQALDQQHADDLSKLLLELPLLVVGYSGRDESVMRSLEAAYSRRGQGMLYWLHLDGYEPSDRVRALLTTACQHGHSAALVEIDGFDDLTRRVAQLLLPQPEVARLVHEEQDAAEQLRPPLRHESYPGQVGVAKSNTWELVPPRTYWRCPAPHITSWADLRYHQGDAPLAAGLLAGNIVALGPREEVARIGAHAPAASVERRTFADRDLRADSVLHGVLREYVVRALARDQWSVVRQRGRYLVFDPRTARPVAGFPNVKWCRAADLDVHFHDQHPMLTLVPDRYVFCEDSSARVPSGAWRVVNRDLSRQWNQPFNTEFNEWIELLGLDARDLSLSLGGSADTSTVTVSKGPRFAKLLSSDPTSRITRDLGPSIAKLDAFALREPVLRFGDGLDTHPLRGLLAHGPAELRMPSLPDPELRLAIVAPRHVDESLQGLLHELVQGHERVETREDYLSPFPGFERAFRLRLRLGTTAGGRVLFPVALNPASQPEQQREALHRVCSAIDQAASASASVVLILFPNEWEHLQVTDSARRLDFHDLVKAYAAPRGIRTQLLREPTLSKEQRLEVLWWLALALYAKSNRVPWSLDALGTDTVHVGIGYGLDLTDRARPVVMCCSHIYQASGLGLRFQLSEIGEPALLRRQNPYLSRDDAYRVGAKALQIVVGASDRPPARVCISKRSPFTPDEASGFLSALGQIPEVELLTVETDHTIRLIRADPSGSAPARFPLNRGTVMPYGTHEALVWVHGDVPGVSSTYRGEHYYQGKSRIPAPLRITRFAGSATLEELASDLLGLSKMDWNSFDLYGKIPVQLTSPTRIARVAKLLGDLRLEDRDYRLFM